MQFTKKRYFKKVLQNKFFKRVSIVVFFTYILYLFYLVFFSHYYGRGEFHRSYNLVPFKTITDFIFNTSNIKIILINIVGNILAFVPLGFLLPMAFAKFNRLRKVLTITLVTTISIELSQYIFGVGACDIDDIILNVLGGIVGFGAYKFLFK